MGEGGRGGGGVLVSEGGGAERGVNEDPVRPQCRPVSVALVVVSSDEGVVTRANRVVAFELRESDRQTMLAECCGR